MEVFVIERDGKPERLYLKEGTAKGAMKQMYDYQQEPERYKVVRYVRA